MCAASLLWCIVSKTSHEAHNKNEIRSSNNIRGANYSPMLNVWSGKWKDFILLHAGRVKHPRPLPAHASLTELADSVTVCWPVGVSVTHIYPNMTYSSKDCLFHPTLCEIGKVLKKMRDTKTGFSKLRKPQEMRRGACTRLRSVEVIKVRQRVCSSQIEEQVVPWGWSKQDLLVAVPRWLTSLI